ncbi:PREDICTED: gustatory receptor for sugar taste 43a-like [Dufourea novaeangliae]|uniref:gustatory receptor for sugar taste 43a-like n=1 Tax=Dufourea novaeangliae TaxID=178035 RepID=UPI00076711D9|nr:PREDICTED: gustatory receptor for sugar taste 43a-like [Dufourea novaeangliae]
MQFLRKIILGMFSEKRAVKSTGHNEAKSDRRKDKRTPENDLCQAIFPIYYVSKVCGLVPVRFIRNVTGRYQAHLSTVDLLYSLCVLLLLLGAQIWGLWRDLKDGWEHSTRLKSRTAVIATCSDVLGVMSLTVVCIVNSLFRWKCLQFIVNKLIEVDEKIGVTNVKNTRWFTTCSTVCSLTYLWTNSILDFYTWTRKMRIDKTMSGKGPINFASLYFMYTVIISTEIQYTVCTYNVGQRLVRLNDCLRNLFNSHTVSTDCIGKSVETAEDAREKGTNTVSRSLYELYSTRGVFRSSNVTDKKIWPNGGITELIMVHSLLCDTVTLINNMFGVVILAATTTCLLHLVITPYFLILQASETHEWIFLAVQGMWCIFHVARMLIIVQPTYSTVVEGKRTAILVSQLLSSSVEANARRQLETFSLQLLHRPLEFSACGLFSLDRALITSIAGAVTTYLVILIQFQNADDTTQILRNASSLRNLTGLKIGF